MKKYCEKCNNIVSDVFSINVYSEICYCQKCQKIKSRNQLLSIIELRLLKLQQIGI